jgi:hypothetical protein
LIAVSPGSFGFDVGPERESELTDLLTGLIIAGHLEPSELASTEGLHKSEDGRMAASRLWWSR